MYVTHGYIFNYNSIAARKFKLDWFCVNVEIIIMRLKVAESLIVTFGV